MPQRKSRVPVLLSALSLLAMLAAAGAAQAQVAMDDQGEFSNGDIGAPPNQDSELVPGLGMQIPTYGGTACPQGTVSASLSPDQRTLSVLFDAYVARAGGSSAPRVAMSCQLNIPFQVPPGYRVQVVKMDYRGFSMIPLGGRSTFGAGYRYLEINGAPTQAPRVLRAKVFQGPRQEHFEVTSIIQGPHWSPCGKPFVLAAESYLNAMTNTANEEVISTVDSLDAVQLPVQYSLRWQRCNGQAGPPPGRGPGMPPPGRPMPPRPPRGGGWR